MRRGLRHSIKSVAVSDGLIVRKYSPMRRGLRRLIVIRSGDDNVVEFESIPRCEGD